MKTSEFRPPAPERIRFFGTPVTVEGGVLVGKWTDELPEDMVPEAERIYVPEERATRAEGQRDKLLELVKAARNVLQPAPDNPIGAHPLLVKLDAAIGECEGLGA